MFMFGASAVTGPILFSAIIPIPEGPGSTLTWRPVANADLPSLRFYFPPCPVFLLHSCSAVQCSAVKLRLFTAMCHGFSLLTCVEQSNNGDSCLFTALSSPMLSLPQLTFMFLKALSPQKRGSFCELNPC